jgi:hypothetical protein
MSSNNREREENKDEESHPVCNCPSVLIADDEPFNAVALEGLLNMLSIKSDKVYDGVSVLEKIR